MKISNGVDIVNIDRIKNITNIDLFAKKILGSAEILRYQELKQKNLNSSQNYLAKRFAGKEAFSKAVKSGIGSLSFKDIEILNDNKGAPTIKLRSTPSDIKNSQISISLSDEKSYAIASVVIITP